MFRGSAKSFAYDSLALALAQEAVSLGVDELLTPVERSFLYMPYMHSESLVIHSESIRLFTKNGVQANIDYAHQHKTIIEKYGRYPHRNDVLGRISTEDELALLSTPGSSF